ncbi:hypothetical protein OCU04_005275 [Sclerotinia nivalis]|uniref:Phytanoyl-CoA dioxygenase n=1 Tax=Sclerotinia nivalis TaxID=352851 RepID=A0A9X0APJ7_9HELO|nr:hypothetical protein OCU04_005275 [Sclerotinia nivalis]
MTVSMSNSSPERSCGDDGPLPPALLIGDNNAAAQAAASHALADILDPQNYDFELEPAGTDNEAAINNDPSSINDEDGPLLFALMLGQNNKSAAADKAIPDTLDTGNFALELASAETNDEEAIGNDLLSINDEDGPLLFALMLTNQNNNNKCRDEPGVKAGSIPDTLNPTNIALELKCPAQDDNVNGVSRSFDKGDGHSVSLNENHHSEDAITEAIPEVLEMETQLLELHSTGDAITGAIPDVLEMKTQLLELHSPGNTITHGIPVILKLNSQAQAAQISALLQGQSIPVAISTKNTVEKSTPKTSNRAPIIGSIMQSRPHVAPDESKNGGLSNEQLQFWRENGYLVIPNALPSDQKDLLLKTVHESAEALAGGGERVQKHSYLPGQKSYVHPCGRAIAALSDYAFNPAVEPLKRIQRIGCGIHRVLPSFRKTILSPFHSTLAKSLGYRDPRIIQSLIIVKAAEIGARVVPHQDGCSGFTDPSSCTTFWYALEDCSVENGCLAVAPGSHRVQPIRRRCKNVDGRPKFVDLERPVYAEIEGVDDSTLPRKNENGEFEYKKLEVKAGTLILMHGNLMHTSEANRSSKSRVAFNFGVVEGEHEWLKDNYLRPYEGTTEFEKL